MKGLIDLLPDDVGDELKAKYARQLDISRHKNYEPLNKVLIRSIHSKKNNFINHAQVDARIKDIKLKKISNTVNQRKRLRRINRERDAKNRELARNGIVVHNHVFMSNGSFYGGRRRSLEWNDEKAKKKNRGLYRRLKENDVPFTY